MKNKSVYVFVCAVVQLFCGLFLSPTVFAYRLNVPYSCATSVDRIYGQYAKIKSIAHFADGRSRLIQLDDGSKWRTDAVKQIEGWKAGDTVHVTVEEAWYLVDTVVLRNDSRSAAVPIELFFSKKSFEYIGQRLIQPIGPEPTFLDTLANGGRVPVRTYSCEIPISLSDGSRWKLICSTSTAESEYSDAQVYVGFMREENACNWVTELDSVSDDVNGFTFFVVIEQGEKNSWEWISIF